MLGKLLKHEINATYKIMLLLDAIVLLLGVVGHFILGSSVLSNNSFSALQVSALMIYILGIIAAFLITTIYLMVRYYKNLYTTEGYLTFTLPVSTTNIINAKIINGFIWRFLNTVLCILSVFILIGSSIFSAEIQWNDVSMAMDEFTRYTGISLGYIIFLLIISIIITSLNGILVFYFSITVGQLWQKHKVIGAILCYIVIYVINQVIAMVTMFATGFSHFVSMNETPTAMQIASFYQIFFAVVIIEAIVFCAAYYFGCVFISKKKVNLD